MVLGSLSKLDLWDEASFDRFLNVRNILTLTRDEQLAQDFLYVALDRLFLPPFREALVSARMESPEIFEMLDRWTTLMPDKFLLKLVSVYLMPKLSREIQRFPSDSVCFWLMPWEKIVGRGNMRSLFESEYRPKISGMLQEWKPESDLIIDLIRPWQDTLTKEDIDKFTARYIVPRLSYSISKLEVDPSD